MKYLSSAGLLSVLLAGNLVSTESKGQESELAQLAAKQLEHLESIVNADAAVTPPSSTHSRTPSRRSVTQPTSGLGAASLQPDTTLHSTARGLTPADEWYRAFPRKTR